MQLYHFCCSHSAEAIERDRTLRPTPVSWKRLDAELRKPMLPVSRLRGAPRVVWLTDLPSLRDPDVVGLSRLTLACDRTEYRVTVETDAAQPWDAWAKRHGANPVWRSMLEEFGWPETWWVATQPLPVASIQSASNWGSA